MTDKKLNDLLEQLHAELGNMQAVDDQGRELLRDLNEDIRKLLERSGAESDESMLQRLQTSVDYFEVTHPALTALLARMLDILSNAGI